jgi:nucleoside-diphosphate-sugar epimerase
VSEGRCLLTGASGFIGGHLAKRLDHSGYELRCLVRANSDTTRLPQTAELITGDLARPDTLTGAAEGCRFVVHCAALVSDWATTKEIARVNVEGTRNLLSSAAQAKVERFVHVSSTDVYGHPGTPDTDERHEPARLANWYSKTKALAEREVQASSLSTTIVRPATVYGPGSKDVIGEIARAIRGGHMLLIGNGRTDAGLCYVENLVDAMMLAMRHARAGGEAFNVTDRLGVSWRTLTADLAQGLDARPPRFSLPYPVAYGLGALMEHGYRALRTATHLTTAPLLSRQAVQVLGVDQSFSNEKARKLLGWEPRFGYREGLEATLDWLRSDQFFNGFDPQ